MAKKKSFENVISNLLGEPVCNLCHAFYDQYVEANVKFRSKAGMKELIIRRQLGKCCKWCAELAGIYTPDNAPDDIYRRHDNCKCMVTYKDEEGYTDAWSKKEFQSQKEARIDRERELISEKSKYSTKSRQDRSEKRIDKNTIERYNNSPAKEKIIRLFNIYDEDVNNGWISPLFRFSQYVELYEKIEKEIIGKTTIGGVKITGQSRHFLQRVIGTGKDPKIFKEKHRVITRSGIEFEDITEALFDGEVNAPIYDSGKKRWGQTYKGKRCKVTVNPETGILVQCNPRGKKK